jgi:hypothetical protein
MNHQGVGKDGCRDFAISVGLVKNSGMLSMRRTNLEVGCVFAVLTVKLRLWFNACTHKSL